MPYYTFKEFPTVGGKIGIQFRKKASIFTKVDYIQSEELSRQSTMKKCYSNCARISSKKFLYHEGFVLVPSIGIWLDHAFLVCDGMVIDPTLGINNRIESGTRYVGVHIPNPLIHMAKKMVISPLITKPELWA